MQHSVTFHPKRPTVCRYPGPSPSKQRLLRAGAFCGTSRLPMHSAKCSVRYCSVLAVVLKKSAVASRFINYLCWLIVAWRRWRWLRGALPCLASQEWRWRASCGCCILHGEWWTTLAMEPELPATDKPTKICFGWRCQGLHSCKSSPEIQLSSLQLTPTHGVCQCLVRDAYSGGQLALYVWYQQQVNISSTVPLLGSKNKVERSLWLGD